MDQDTPTIAAKTAVEMKTTRQPDAPKPVKGQADADASAQAAAPSAPTRRRRAGRMLALASAIVAVAGLYLYWNYAKHFESTDDAFIAARQFAVEPKVSGYITAVPVTDNQHVKAGDVIARIEQDDYRIALEQAQAKVAAAQASIDNADAQIAMQDATIAQTTAQVAAQTATVKFAEQQDSRYEALSKHGYGSVQDAQQYSSQYKAAMASQEAAQQALVVSQRQLGVMKAQRASAVASLKQANTELDQAKLNLSYTTVVAAQDGRVAQLSAAVGQYVQAGSALAMFVPDQVWVTANFKETQIDHMRPGQPVTMSIDAYPDLDLKGTVESVQPGSGTAFSLLPAQNATGNYVKITQRVPVKIAFDKPPETITLGPGMSVEPSVRIDPNPSLIERIWSFE